MSQNETERQYDENGQYVVDAGSMTVEERREKLIEMLERADGGFLITARITTDQDGDEALEMGVARFIDDENLEDSDAKQVAMSVIEATVEHGVPSGMPSGMALGLMQKLFGGDGPQMAVGGSDDSNSESDGRPMFM